MRLRLTALYGCLFLLSGAGLLAITNVLVQHQSKGTAFYISRTSDGAQEQIKGVIGGFSAPLALPSVEILRQNKAVAKPRSAGPYWHAVRVVPVPSSVGLLRSPSGSSTPSGSSASPGSAAPSASSASSGSAAPAGATGLPTVLAGGQLSAVPGEPRRSTNRLANTSANQLRAQARQLTTLAGKQRSAELGHLLSFSVLALGIMGVISIALGWLISGRALRPLDEAFEAQRRFVANASHELRTPLAMMRTSLDVAVAKPGESSPQLQALEHKLREGLDQADALLESFLTLARAQRGAPAEQSAVAIAPLLHGAIDDHACAAAERGVQVSDDILTDGLVNGNETLLRRMFDNLIDNAIRHNEPGGWVRVLAGPAPGGRRGSTAAARSGKLTRVVIENGGPPLSETEVADLTEPFRRPGPERTASQDGHGLGLSIVAAIAAAHGAALSLDAREDGGLRACVDLPRASTPSRAGRPAEAQLRAGAPS